MGLVFVSVLNEEAYKERKNNRFLYYVPQLRKPNKF